MTYVIGSSTTGTVDPPAPGDGRDPLTGALDRARLLLALDAALSAGPAALCIVGLDHFRLLNQAHGHAAGDAVLVAIAELITDRLSPADVLGRVGSDEFAVVLPGAEAGAARAVAEDILGGIRSARRTGGTAVTASIGTASADGGAAADLLAEADGALARAKESGRDRVAVAAGEGRGRALESVTWASAIREALECGGLDVWAQPIVALQGDAAPRYELLVRLNGASPVAFLPTAERFGQMQAIDGWVVGRALDLLASNDGIVLHVNLSPASIGDERLTTFLERVVVASGIDPARLVFEITEGAAIADTEAVAATARRLRALGSGLALDDFGTGFASFGHLRRLPFDVLKIAGDFVRGLHGSRLDRLTVEAMAHVAGGMGIVTVAEYVEDGATLGTLRELGVGFAQGMHVGAPAPTGDHWPG